MPSVQQERALLMREFGDKFGYNQEMIFALARKMTEYNFWFSPSEDYAPLEYTPLVALYLRDFYHTDLQPGQQLQPYGFDVDMRAIATNLCKYRHKNLSMPLEEFYYDFLITLLTQHSDRLRVCYALSDDMFKDMQAYESLLLIVIKNVRQYPAPKMKFALWVVEKWLPHHFRTLCPQPVAHDLLCEI